MRHFVSLFDAGPGAIRLALVLALVCLLTPRELAPALAAPPPPTPFTRPGQPDGDPELVPPPAGKYALDDSRLGRLLDLGLDWHQAGSENAPDGSFSQVQYRTLDSGPDGVRVESSIYVLRSADQAGQQYTALQMRKQNETGAEMLGEAKLPGSASGYQLSRPSEGVAFIMLHFRNAVSLIEIRGTGQYADRATRDKARALLNTVLQAFEDTVSPSEGSSSPLSTRPGA